MAKNGQFALSLQAFVEQTKQNADTVIREATFALLNSILLRSPVDTGRFRGNWNVGLDGPDRTTNDTLTFAGSQDARGEAAAEYALARGSTRLSAFSAFGGGDTIYLSNGLPYAIELEYGHSTQAPSGVVGISVIEFQQHIERAAQDLAK